jgi:hypothetical protein
LALFAQARREKSPHAVPLPAGQLLEFLRRRSLWPAQQSINLGCFRPFPKRILLFCRFPGRGLLGRVKIPPDSLERYLPVGEFLDRRHARQIVPERHQSFQRPGARRGFPFFKARHVWQNASIFGRGKGRFFAIGKGHLGLFLAASWCSHSIHPSVPTQQQVLPVRLLRPPGKSKMTGLRGLASPYDVGHAQTTQSHSHHPSSTEHTFLSRNRLRSGRVPDPELSQNRRQCLLPPRPSGFAQFSRHKPRASQNPTLSSVQAEGRKRLGNHCQSEQNSGSC